MNPMLMCDYYKTCHAEMLPEGITKSVSYFIPRGSRIPHWDSAVFFGLRGFIKEFLEIQFDEEFFGQPRWLIKEKLETVMTGTMGQNPKFIDRAMALYDLGYLPIEIFALPEGTRTPMGVPMFGLTNTHADFAWLPQYLESMISCEMWHPICVATVADQYRKLVDKEYALTVDDSGGQYHNSKPANALALFSMRGEESMHSATISGAAWATRFKGCATVSTADYLCRNYNATVFDSIKGSPSTEHAVMCSNTAVDGNEVDFLKRMLTDLYKDKSFSVVLDSYDYWHMVKEVLPTIKDEILAHNGKMLVRGDSGDPVDVTVETVKALWDIFGGTVNSKGYKVLDRHVGVVYGDSITLERAGVIFRLLRKEGFAANNVSLGVGSFSTQAIKVDGEYYPFTRDTFNIAIKCTYVEVNGQPYMVHKEPKGAGFKKSPKGCIDVYYDEDNKLVAKDGYKWSDVGKWYHNNIAKFRTVYKDGMFVDERDTIDEIRKRMEK